MRARASSAGSFYPAIEKRTTGNALDGSAHRRMTVASSRIKRGRRGVSRSPTAQQLHDRREATCAGDIDCRRVLVVS